MTARRDLRLLWISAGSSALFGGTTLLVRRGTPEPWELSVFEAVNGLPDWLYYVIWPFMQYGVFGTIPVAAVLAFLLRQRRLSTLIAGSGVSVYILAKLVKNIAQRGRPMVFLEAVIEREHFARSSLGYISGHVAVAATIATLTTVHLPRPLQRATAALVCIVMFGRMYVGAHLPLDMIGGVAMGIAAGSLVAFLFDGGNRADPATRTLGPNGNAKSRGHLTPWR